jgi:hypothetical protein
VPPAVEGHVLIRLALFSVSLVYQRVVGIKRKSNLIVLQENWYRPDLSTLVLYSDRFSNSGNGKMGSRLNLGQFNIAPEPFKNPIPLKIPLIITAMDVILSTRMLSQI